MFDNLERESQLGALEDLKRRLYIVDAIVRHMEQTPEIKLMHQEQQIAESAQRSEPIAIAREMVKHTAVTPEATPQLAAATQIHPENIPEPSEAETKAANEEAAQEAVENALGIAS